MLLTRVGRLVLSAGVALLAGSQILCAAGLHLRAVEGHGIVVAPGAVSSRRISIVVENDLGQPLAGATVRFRLPAEGPTGRFASGLTTETIVSGPDGRATVYGIAWNGQPGPLVVSVTCSLEADTAELKIPVEIGQRSKKELNSSNPGHFPSAGSSRKWLTYAVVIGGGAAAAAAVALMHGSSTPPAPVIPGPITITETPPVVGQPSIAIGPQH